MREMDEYGLMLCKYQADLFEYSSKEMMPSRVFIKQFAYSFLAKRLDKKSFLYESIDIPKAYNEVIGGFRFTGSVVFEQPIIRWIGYIYRYISYIYEKPTKKIYERIKPQELYNLYDSYHALDNELAIRRILEAKDINFEIKPNLTLLRKIYKI